MSVYLGSHTQSMPLTVVHLSKRMHEHPVLDQNSEVLVHSLRLSWQSDHHGAFRRCFDNANHTARQACHRSDLQCFRLHVLSDRISAFRDKLFYSFRSSIARCESSPSWRQYQVYSSKLSGSTDGFFDLGCVIWDNPKWKIELSFWVSSLLTSTEWIWKLNRSSRCIQASPFHWDHPAHILLRMLYPILLCSKRRIASYSWLKHRLFVSHKLRYIPVCQLTR